LVARLVCLVAEVILQPPGVPAVAEAFGARGRQRARRALKDLRDAVGVVFPDARAAVLPAAAGEVDDAVGVGVFVFVMEAADDGNLVAEEVGLFRHQVAARAPGVADVGLRERAEWPGQPAG
jgi:hypothetical protein